MAFRFFVGVAEALFGTGAALYLSLFFPRKELGLRHAWFVCGSSIASAIAGSVAYLIQHAKTSIESWRLICGCFMSFTLQLLNTESPPFPTVIVEAAPTIFIGIAVYIWLPDSIAKARFLSSREREIAEGRLYRATIDVERKVQSSNDKSSNIITSFLKSTFNLSNFVDALRDPFTYVSVVLLFILNVGFSSVPVYLPVILQGMGYSSLRAQAFSAPPYVGAFIVAISLVAISDRLDIREIFVLLASLVGCTGYLILATVDSNYIRYFGVWLVVLGLFVYIPLLYSWLLSNTLGESKKGLSLTILGTFSQRGPLLGVRLYPSHDAPYYRTAQWINFSLLLLAILITSITMFCFWRINRSKDIDMTRLQAMNENDHSGKH